MPGPALGVTAAVVAAAIAASAAPRGPGAGPGTEGAAAVEVVATGIPRPLQVVAEGGGLLVLAAGARGEVAGELYRVDLRGPGPADLAGRARLRIPFAEGQPASLGSLAARPRPRELYLGEENGRRIWRLDEQERFAVYATGLARLAGGSTLAFDGVGRLVVLDHVDPRLSPPEERLPGLEHLRDEDYQGPVLFRLTLDADVALPRRLDRVAPLFPRGWSRPAPGALLPRLVAVAPWGEALIVLDSGGGLFRLDGAGRLVPHATLPSGQYVRVNMVAAPDGTLYVSSGFWITRLFRVTPDGTVATLAGGLADPQGLALLDGDLYVAESARHRILRLRLR